MLSTGETLYNKEFILENKKKITIKNIIKKVLYPLYSFVYILFIMFQKKKINKNKKYYFSICSIFRDEAIYLKEWIEFHLIIGVEHFYLYNNFSEDNYLEILEPYIKQNLVTLINWPYQQGQKTAYGHCYNNFSEETNWIAFIDLDEFIVLKYKTDIKEWLEPYERYPSIAVYWKMFGTSGKLNTNNNELVTEQYVVSWDKLYKVAKCFFNTSFNPYDLKFIHNISAIKRKFILPPINENKKIVLWNNEKRGRKNTIQINHYFSKSYNDYVKKKMPRGSAYQDYNQKDFNYFFVHEQKNISTDHTIFRFLIKLKNNMGIL